MGRVPETQTRGWVAAEAQCAEWLLKVVRFYQCPTVGDVENLAACVERMAVEVERLHGVIRDYQARVGEKAGDSRA